jgi:hypothetical protein
MSIREKFKQLDVAGATLFIGAVVCLLLSLQWGGTTYSWSDSRVWGCFLGCGLLTIIFVALQLYLGERATLPRRMFVSQRTIVGCAVFTVLVNIAMQT